ncbi:MAG: hypothetical protein RLZZ360_122 [Candidatus Parcubacteria bacterium]|jgi:hypothetical protein
MATKQYTGYTIEDSPYGSVSGDFNKRQQDRQGFGVQNVKATGNTSTRRVSERAFEYGGRQTANLGKRLKEEARARELSGKNDVMTKGLQRTGERLNKMGRVARASSRGFAFRKGVVSKAAARLQVGFTLGWTGFLNILSLPVGIMALAGFGGAALIDSTTGGEIGARVAAWMLGLEYFNIWVLAIGLYVLHAFLVITMFAGSYIQLKLGGIQPLHGQAAVAKNLTFLSAFLISAIPGTTFVPWIFIWLFIVMLYPN